MGKEKGGLIKEVLGRYWGGKDNPQTWTVYLETRHWNS